MKIDTTNWKEFRVDKLFDVETSLSFDMVNIDISNTMDDEYKYEFIIRSKDNYGVKGYVKHLGIGSNKKNKITISQVGTIVAQYRDSDYYTSQNVFNLEPKFDLTENKALFFVNIFNCMLRKYIGYSDYPTKESLKKEVISLPAIDPDTPDFDYMEKYIEEMKFKYIDELEKDNDSNIDKALEVTGLSYEDLDKDLVVEPADKYEEFRVGDLFDKKTIKGVPKSNENLKPNDDGYHIFGQNIQYQYPQKVLLDKKYLQVLDKPIIAYTSSTAQIGFINESFYRTGDNGAFQGLFLKSDKANLNIILYLLTVLKKQFKGYGYDTSMGDIVNIKLLLPAIDKDTPDFDYMEKAIYIYIYCKKD